MPESNTHTCSIPRNGGDAYGHSAKNKYLAQDILKSNLVDFKALMNRVIFGTCINVCQDKLIMSNIRSYYRLALLT